MSKHVERETIRPQNHAPRRALGGAIIVVVLAVMALLLVARSQCVQRDGYEWYWIPPVGCERINE